MNSNTNSNNAPVAAPAPAPKVKKPMTAAMIEVNEQRLAAWEELKAINPKATWINATRIVSYRRPGKTQNRGKEAELLQRLRNTRPANNNATPVPAKTVRKKKLAFANNVAATGVKTASRRNRARNILIARLQQYGKKPKMINISTLAGLLGKTNANTNRNVENRFLEQVDRAAAAAVEAAAAAEAEKVAKKAAKEAERAAKKAAAEVERTTKKAEKAAATAATRVARATSSNTNHAQAEANLRERLLKYEKKPSEALIKKLVALRHKGKNTSQFFSNLNNAGEAALAKKASAVAEKAAAAAEKAAAANAAKAAKAAAKTAKAVALTSAERANKTSRNNAHAQGILATRMSQYGMDPRKANIKTLAKLLAKGKNTTAFFASLNRVGAERTARRNAKTAAKANKNAAAATAKAAKTAAKAERNAIAAEKKTAITAAKQQAKNARKTLKKNKNPYTGPANNYKPQISEENQARLNALLRNSE